MKKIARFIKLFFRRPQRKMSILACLRSGGKGFLTITLISIIGYFSQTPILMAPFAASCITIYTSPDEEFSQPMNVFGGYLITTIIGVLFLKFLPEQWWILGAMVGISIAAMAYLRVTHPPAGSVPILIYAYKTNSNIELLFYPGTIGVMLLVLIAIILHKITKIPYPAAEVFRIR